MNNHINIDDLNSTDISIVLNCLNAYTKISYESPSQISMKLLSFLLISFGELLDTLNPFYIRLDMIPSQNSLSVLTLIAKKQRFSNWDVPSKYFDPQSLQILHYTVEDNVLILMILNILRNYSSEANNEQIIASSTKLLNHLWSIILTSHSPSQQYGSSPSAAVQISFEILCNISSKIDLTGNMKLRSSVLEDCSLLERKEAVVIQLSPHFSTISPEYVVVTDLIVSTLFLNLRTRQSRMVTLRSLDLIAKLASVPENASYFQTLPDASLLTIIDFLNVSYSFLDPYSNSKVCANATSVPPFVSESFSDAADNEFRDLALEVVAQLCANSSKIQSRLAEMKQCFRNLLIIIRNLKAEKTSLRNIDLNLTKAVQILNQVLSRTFDMAMLYALQLDLCTEFGDDILSDTICSNFYMLGHQQSNFSAVEEYNE